MSLLHVNNKIKNFYRFYKKFLLYERVFVHTRVYIIGSAADRLTLFLEASGTLHFDRLNETCFPCLNASNRYTLDDSM